MASKPCVFDENCGSQQVLELIANKWTALVIYALAPGNRRFSELQRQIGGVSQKMLTQTLRRLERDGLVTRKVYPVVPPRVEYSLTRLGETLIEPLKAICKWAEAHLPELRAARARHRDRSAQAQHQGVQVDIPAPAISIR
jgi:DNA-binding HxlR family transcriptional regulator